MDVLLTIAALVGTLAALGTVTLAFLTLRKTDAMLRQAHEAHLEEMKLREALHREERRQRMIAAMVRAAEQADKIREIAFAESGRSPGARLGGRPDIPTGVPAAQRLLRVSLAAIFALGGPHLPASYELATRGFQYVLELTSAVNSALEELCSRQAVFRDTHPGHRASERISFAG
jgi:hypothetical protein